MSRKYTAQEMRDMGEQILFTDDDWYEDAGHMLLQAADMLERKKKRKKKYEYAEMMSSGVIWNNHFSNKSYIKTNMMDSSRAIVRREVGEWEELC